MNELKALQRRHWSLLIAGYLIIIVILFSCINIFKHIIEEPVNWITQDPAASLSFNPLIGIVSHLGVILWSFTVAVCVFASFVMLKQKRMNSFRFLLASGLLSAILLFDDLLSLHESILPKFFHIPEGVVFMFYVLAFLVYFFSFRTPIFRFNYIILGLAFCFFGASMAEDIFFNDVSQLFEDSLKFIGIFNWFFYFTCTCYSLLIIEELKELDYRVVVDRYPD